MATSAPDLSVDLAKSRKTDCLSGACLRLRKHAIYGKV